MSETLAKRFPTLKEVKDRNPNSLVTQLSGFVYSNDSSCSLGSGSFGKVVLGWTKDGKREVAVKVVERSFLNKDRKLKENLEREISILKLMTDCDYVVKIIEAQEAKNMFVLIMEKCDYDLDHLLKKSPLSEDQVITFLYQLAEGMKALRKQNIVHRDLKPGNILIQENTATRKKTFKLADFGFARKFKDDTNRNISMKSLAGTPVYMAPEALSCLFSEGKVYDDKVDIWSIGALLYKVIVGECGFYAQLQKILDYLSSKKDAIAFEVAPSKKIIYIEELPLSVNARLSEPFRDQMNTLLRQMLKVDPRERISFPLFFDFVDDIITSKIEVFSLLHGTSLKIVFDPNVKAETLVKMVCNKWKTPQDNLIIFSPKCYQYIDSRRALSAAGFEELLSKAGGSYGHAKLYVLEINQQKTALLPDVSCLEPLKFAIDNGQIVQLISEAKFCDEIVHMIHCVEWQLKAQLEGLDRLTQFTVQEIGLSPEYSRLMEGVHQALAKVALVLKWQQKELEASGSCVQLLADLGQRKKELQTIAEELVSRVIPTLTGPFNLREYKKSLSNYKDSAKRLRRAQKDAIPAKCRELCDKCSKVIISATSKTRQQLLPFQEALAARRALYDRSAKLLDVSELLSNVEEEREKALKQTSPPGGRSGGAPHLHPPTDPALAQVDGPNEVAQLTSDLATERARSQALEEELARLKCEKDLEMGVDDSSFVPIEERTLSSPVPRLSEAVDSRTDLLHELRQFCSEARKFTLPMSVGHVFPDLMDDEDYDMRQLLVMSQELANSLKSSLPALRELTQPKRDGLMLRIGAPSDYRKGDVAAFVPFKMNRGFTLPSVLHLRGSKPCMLMDIRSFSALDIMPGRMPQLLFARLTESPRHLRLENHEQMAKDLGEEKGDFYRVNAEPVSLQWSGKCPLLLPK